MAEGLRRVMGLISTMTDGRKWPEIADFFITKNPILVGLRNDNGGLDFSLLEVMGLTAADRSRRFPSALWNFNFFSIVCLTFKVRELRIRGLQQNGENLENHKEILNKTVGERFHKIYEFTNCKWSEVSGVKRWFRSASNYFVPVCRG